MDGQTSGAWLEQQMKRRGLRARDIAHALDIAENSVNNWRRSKGAPKDEHARELAGLLGLTEVEIRKRFGLYIHSIDGLTEEQAQLELAAIRRRIAMLEPKAQTERERAILEELRQLIDSPDDVDEPG